MPSGSLRVAGATGYSWSSTVDAHDFYALDLDLRINHIYPSATNARYYGFTGRTIKPNHR